MPKREGTKKALVRRVKKAVKKSRRRLGAEKFEKELTRTITFLEKLQQKVTTPTPKASGAAAHKGSGKTAAKVTGKPAAKPARKAAARKPPAPKAATTGATPTGGGVAVRKK